jgi:hypothetical protein
VDVDVEGKGVEVDEEVGSTGGERVGRAGVEDLAEEGTATTPPETVEPGTGGETLVMGMLTAEAEADPPGVLPGVIVVVALFCRCSCCCCWRCRPQGKIAIACPRVGVAEPELDLGVELEAFGDVLDWFEGVDGGFR